MKIQIENLWEIGNHILTYPYGSRVYGTASDKSDYDYIAIDFNNDSLPYKEIIEDNIHVHKYSYDEFKKELLLHKINILEIFYLNYSDIFRENKELNFKLDLKLLRHEISQKASNSFVKAKKKIEKEKDFYVGLKSLFHSLRILDFGCQIAKNGKIIDYSSANKYWFDIVNFNSTDWEFLKERYQPIYNSLATEFRKLVPK